MSQMAFRHIPPDVANDVARVKGLLLYMWKAVNSGDRMNKQVIVRGPNTSQLHSGSLNIFGSGIFSEIFLKNWQKEGFPDYVVPNDDDSVDADMVISSYFIT
jgi:hypothetical protein